ncbi:MAG: glycosyltransferase family 2 protein [Bacteroidaceae bacterium]|nr:glycosyltransferase family 2 protein [Bacteroidaceae bacterium]
MKTALIVTTYNWPAALRLVLESIARQTRLPDCVIVADDGSTADTARLIAETQEAFPCPLIHVWQEDKGFRLAKIRNRAIAEAARRGMDYVIQIDGDIILHRRFVADHLADATPGTMLCGARAHISEAHTAALTKAGHAPALTCLSPGVEHRLNAVRSPLLSRFARGSRRKHGCNLSYWLRDVLAINGYDEVFEGWGYEDSDFARRMEDAGVRRQRIKFKAVCFHLHHKSNVCRDNYDVMQACLKRGLVRAERGVDQYLLQ